MVFILPSRFFAIQESQKLLAPDFIASSFYQKGAPPPWADQSVDLLDQIFRQ